MAIKRITQKFIDELDQYFGTDETFMLGVNFICKEFGLTILEIKPNYFRPNMVSVYIGLETPNAFKSRVKQKFMRLLKGLEYHIQRLPSRDKQLTSATGFSTYKIYATSFPPYSDNKNGQLKITYVNEQR